MDKEAIDAVMAAAAAATAAEAPTTSPTESTTDGGSSAPRGGRLMKERKLFHGMDDGGGDADEGDADEVDAVMKAAAARLGPGLLEGEVRGWCCVLGSMCSCAYTYQRCLVCGSCLAGGKGGLYIPRGKSWTR